MHVHVTERVCFSCARARDPALFLSCCIGVHTWGAAIALATLLLRAPALTLDKFVVELGTRRGGEREREWEGKDEGEVAGRADGVKDK